MPIGIMFWVLMILWFIFGWAYKSSPDRFGPYGWYGNAFLELILFGLLGWEVFGPVLHR